MRREHWWQDGGKGKATRLRQNLTKLLFTATVGRARFRDFTSIIFTRGAAPSAFHPSERNSRLSSLSVAAAGTPQASPLVSAFSAAGVYLFIYSFFLSSNVPFVFCPREKRASRTPATSLLATLALSQRHSACGLYVSVCAHALPLSNAGDLIQRIQQPE